MFGVLKRLFGRPAAYRPAPGAAVVACYFNPTANPYRRAAFDTWHASVRHLDHRIVECVMGGGRPELPAGVAADVVHTPTVLFHKEALLNRAIKALPARIKYVFWLDADVTFTNPDWLRAATARLAAGELNVVQPFEWGYHLERGETTPNAAARGQRRACGDGVRVDPAARRVWRSFGACHEAGLSAHPDYDTHGHVGFAWGARRDILTACPLYDRGLVGGADHVVAHAAAGQPYHPCLGRAFHRPADLARVEAWALAFAALARGRVGYVPGDLYHLWHGDLAARQYLPRMREFSARSSGVSELPDAQGLYNASVPLQQYVWDYMRSREDTAPPAPVDPPAAQAASGAGDWDGGSGAAGGWDASDRYS